MRIADCIATARPIIGDAKDPNRYSETRLLGYGNDAIQMLAIAKPELFRAIGNVACAQGLAIQTFPRTESNGIVDVLYVKGGNVVTRTDRFTMNRMRPQWMQDTPAAAKHWMPVEGDPNRVLIWPPAPADQVLVCLYNAVPPEYAVDDEVEISNSYRPIITNYIIAMAEMANDPSVNSGRAATFMQLFATGIGESDDTNHMAKSKETKNDAV